MTEERIIIDRAFRAKSARDEFYDPAFETVNEAYMARLAEIAVSEPWATDKITKLAMAVRVLKEVRAQVENIIVAGEMAKASKAHADKIAAIPVEKRRLMGLPLK